MKRFMILAVLAAFPTMALAQEQVSTTLRVTATVVPNCRVDIQPMSFGLYDPLLDHSTAPLQAQAEMSLLCTRNVPANIELDQGGYGTDIRARLLGLGSDRLGYGLFLDPARTRVWGIGNDAMVLNGTERQGSDPLLLTIYGAIPPAQEVIAGDYTDIVTARVNF